MVSTDRIDGLTAEVAIKAPVRVATTANITLSGAQTIDDVAVVTNDRVLVKDQTDGVENGIYCASTTAWARSKDFNGARDVVQGTKVFVNAGTASGGRNFNLDTPDDIIIDTTSLSFSVDTGGVIPSDELPLVAGAVDAGASSEVSRTDHVHPSAKDVPESQTNKILNDNTNFIHANGIHVACRNVSGGDFGVLTPVYDSGWNAGQGTIEILGADANGIGTYPALGLLDAPIANNANGDVLTDGVIVDVDTDGSLFGESWSDGDILYISEIAGELTNVRPTEFDAQVQAIARVLRAHGANGVLFVQGAGRVNAVPNLINANAQVQWKKGADVVAAAALPIITDGNYFNVTGNTNITTIDTTGKIGTVVKLHFVGTPDIVDDADNIINNTGGLDITISAGDELEYTEYASGKFIRTGGALASGTAFVSGGAAGINILPSQLTTSGSTKTFTIPAGATRVNIFPEDVSDNANSSPVLLRLADSGGVDVTGYSGSVSSNTNGTSFVRDVFSTDFHMSVIAQSDAALSVSGELTLSKAEDGSNKWNVSGKTSSRSGTYQTSIIEGSITLTGELTEVEISVGGTYDLGNISMTWEQ